MALFVEKAGPVLDDIAPAVEMQGLGLGKVVRGRIGDDVRYLAYSGH